MKKTYLVMLVATVLYISSCGSKKSPDVNTDTVNIAPNITAPDNSNATNPSLADTAYPDTSHKIKDTLKR